MAGIKISDFKGIAPKIQTRLLPDGMAQIADNCNLQSGALVAWNRSILVANSQIAPGTVLSIFRMHNGASDYWLNWNRDVNCQPSLIAGDATQRIFYTGDGEPRVSNLAAATTGAGAMPIGFYVLGVAAPLLAPALAVVGGTGANVSRAYIETFVTPWGEEGAPSPATPVITGPVDGSWNLSALNAAPINGANVLGAVSAAGVVTVQTSSTAYLRAGEEVAHAGVGGMTDLNGTFTIASIVDATHYTVALTTAQVYTAGGTWSRVAPHNTTGMTRRIYRTMNGAYQFVVELPIATTVYADTLADTALGEICQSIGWDMPPTDLQGLQAHPGGFLVGVSQNNVCMCDPYHPHAWPIAYQQVTKYPLVGVGINNSAIIACTTGTPYVLTGSSPDSIQPEQTDLVYPCIAKRTICDVGDGIVYATTSGIAFIGAGGSFLITKDIIDRKDWLALNPADMQFAYYDGKLFGIANMLNADQHSGFIFDLVNKTFASSSTLASCIHTDPENGNLYIVASNVIKQWDGDKTSNQTFDWLSRVYTMQRPVNLGAAQIDADFNYLNADQSSDVAAQAAADAAYNAAILAGDTYGELDAAMLDDYMLDGSALIDSNVSSYATRFLRLSLYADGVFKYSEPVIDGKTFSLPAGYKSQRYEVRISGNIPVFGVMVAESPVGLNRL